MCLNNILIERSNNSCELCASETQLDTYIVPPTSSESADRALLLCSICLEQIKNPEKIDPNHWHCLNESMWSEHAPIQVMAWRMLNLLSNESWAQDLLAQIYLEDDILNWAKEGLTQETTDDDSVPTKDSNGTSLSNGDSVTLIKDLTVKGAGFTAKRGTLVKNISLTSNPEHIEGKVNGTQIVLVSAYLKKV